MSRDAREGSVLTLLVMDASNFQAMNMDYQWYDFIGNVGVFCILLAYLLLQLGRLGSRTLAYSLLNGVGASFILVSLIYDFNLSAFIIELFWLLISMYGLMRLVLSKERANRESLEGVGENHEGRE